MLRFKDFIKLDEKVLIIGDNSRSQTYPKFNQILVLVGGGGSGKGFTFSKMIAFEGKKFDVDELKSNFLKFKPKTLVDAFEKETGRYVESIDLGNPDDVFLLHQFFKDHNLPEKSMNAFFLNASTLKNKPNVIFDVTLKDLDKLKEISEYAELGGYDKKNISLVWVVNDINVAVVQNTARERKVPMKILLKTHEGASRTMKQIIEETNELRKYADGQIWLLWNKANVDSAFTKTKQGNLVLDRYGAVEVKKKGQAAIPFEEISSSVIEKINSYVPNTSQW